MDPVFDRSTRIDIIGEDGNVGKSAGCFFLDNESRAAMRYFMVRASVPFVSLGCGPLHLRDEIEIARCIEVAERLRSYGSLSENLQSDKSFASVDFGETYRYRYAFKHDLRDWEAREQWCVDNWGVDIDRYYWKSIGSDGHWKRDNPSAVNVVFSDPSDAVFYRMQWER